MSVCVAVRERSYSETERKEAAVRVCVSDDRGKPSQKFILT